MPRPDCDGPERLFSVSAAPPQSDPLFDARRPGDALVLLPDQAASALLIRCDTAELLQQCPADVGVRWVLPLAATSGSPRRVFTLRDIGVRTVLWAPDDWAAPALLSGILDQAGLRSVAIDLPRQGPWPTESPCLSGSSSVLAPAWRPHDLAVLVATKLNDRRHSAAAVFEQLEQVLEAARPMLMQCLLLERGEITQDACGLWDALHAWAADVWDLIAGWGGSWRGLATELESYRQEMLAQCR